MATLFLSHSSIDEVLVRRLESWLIQSGFDDLFVDHSGLLTGDKWTEQLRRNKASCRVVACLVTPAWLRSAECYGEFLAGWYAGKRMMPLMVLQGETLDEVQSKRLSRILAEDQGADLTKAGAPDALDLDAYPDVSGPLIEGLKAAGALARIGLDPEAFSAVLGRYEEGDLRGQLVKPPFPGLKSFEDTDADAAIFYGRDPELISSMEELRELRTDASGAKAYVIQGASGSGKSSFMKAGILPRLRRERGWVVPRAFRPGTDPLYEFTDALSRSGLDRSPGRIRDELLSAWTAARQAARDKAAAIGSDLSPTERQAANKDIDDGFLTALWQTLGPHLTQLLEKAGRPDATVLIPVDQGEEIARAKGESGDALADYLRACLAAPRTDDRATCLVVLTVRSDSWQELQESPRFHGIPTRPYDLRTLPIYRYDNAIERPAARYGVEFEPQLVEALMNDAGGKDALPLLAFTLERLWNQYEKDRRVRKENYESLGRMAGLLRDAAERALRGLDPTARPGPLPERVAPGLDQLGARTFVPALAQISDHGSVLRRVAPLTAFGDDERDMLRHFESWRLVVASGEQVEVAHEALFREWPRFGDWLKPEKARLETLRGVESAADTWASQEERKDLLLHSGRRLRQSFALDKISEYAAQLTSHPQARRYLAACRRAQRNRRIMATGASATLAAGLGFGAFLMQSDASQGAVLQHASAEIREGRPDSALPFALIGLPARGDILFLAGKSADDLVLEAGGDRLQPLKGLAYLPYDDYDFSPDKKWFRAKMKSGEQRLFNLETWSPAADFRTIGSEAQMTFTKDNRWLIAVDQQSGFVLFDLTNERIVRELKQARYALSADDKWLFLTDPAGNAELIDLSEQNRPARPFKAAPPRKPTGDWQYDMIPFAAFSGAGDQLLAQGDDGILYQLAADAGGEPKPLGKYALIGPHSPDGRWSVVIDEQEHQYAIDLTGELPPRQIADNRNSYGEFIGKGALLKVQNSGSISLFDLASSAAPKTFGGPSGVIDQLSARARWRAIGTVNGEAFIFDMTGERPPLNLGEVSSLYFQDFWTDPTQPAPEYKVENELSFLMVTRRDGSLRFYNLVSGGAPIDVTSAAGGYDVFVSADRNWILADQQDGTALVYDISSQAPPARIGTREPNAYFQFLSGTSIATREGGAAPADGSMRMSKVYFLDKGRPPTELNAHTISSSWNEYLLQGRNGELMFASGKTNTRRIIGQAGNGQIDVIGKLLRYTDTSGTLQSVYLGVEPRNIDIDLKGSNYIASSEDGRWLAFVTDAGEFQLHDLEGHAPVRIKQLGPLALEDVGPDTTYGAYLSFSSKGEWLTVRWGKGRGTIFNLKTGSATDIEKMNAQEVYPTYYLEDQWISLAMAEGGLVLRNIDDDVEPLTLSDVSSSYSVYGLSQRWLQYSSKSGSTVLIDLENGGAERRLGNAADFSLIGDGKYLGMSDLRGSYNLISLDAPPSEARGVKLREELCEREAAAVSPFDGAVRQPKVATPVSERLMGRPWNPCDWRGLGAGPDGWSQALRRFDVTVRKKPARDYLCGEDAAGKPEADRVRMCQVTGVDAKWIAKLPEEASADVKAEEAKPEETETVEPAPVE